MFLRIFFLLLILHVVDCQYNYQQPDYTWKQLGPSDTAALRKYPLNFYNPLATQTQNYGYKNDVATVYLLCSTGDCGRGK